MFEVHAATAMSASRIWFSDPHIRVTIKEEDARWVSPGSYWDYDGSVTRVVRIERPEDWFDDQVTLVLTNGPVEERIEDLWKPSPFTRLLEKLPRVGALTTAVNWLEDTFLPA